MFFAKDESLKDISIGIFVFAIGLVGLLRMNLEIVRTYQSDWHKSTATNYAYEVHSTTKALDL